MQKIQSWLQNGALNIFGLPFSGKDTQGHQIASLLDAAFLSSGKILRESQQVASTIDKGQLAPSQAFFEIVLPHFADDTYIGQPLVLSSIGRWHGEEQAVLEALEHAKHPLKAVVFLSIPEDEIIKRYQRAEHLQDRGERKDDSLHIIQKRLAEFRAKTLPVINFYKEKGLLIEIDGTLTREKVTEDIINKLLAFAEAA